MKIAKDKALHLGVGVVIGFVVTALVGFPGVGTIVAGAAGFGKEAYDKHQNEKAAKAGQPAAHTVDKKDAFFTVGGGVIGDLLGLAFQLLSRVF